MGANQTPSEFRLDFFLADTHEEAHELHKAAHAHLSMEHTKFQKEVLKKLQLKINLPGLTTSL